MKFNVYAIRDVHTGFLTPTFEPSDAVARRNFEAASMREGTLLHSHPQDFQLLRIGEFDSDTGVLTSCLLEVIM